MEAVLASSRSVLKPNPGQKLRPLKRMGVPTKADKALVAQVVLDQPAEITPAQITGLAKTLRRSKDAIKQMIEEARENFVAGAERYVEIHREATEAALADGDNEQALKGAQWALQNISAEGVRVVEKTVEASSGSRIMIGIKLGDTKAAVETKIDGL